MHDQFDVTLEDSDLLGEVELTTNLIIAASESDEHLDSDEIDQILGVAHAARPTTRPDPAQQVANSTGPLLRSESTYSPSSGLQLHRHHVALGGDLSDPEPVGEVTALARCRAAGQHRSGVGVGPGLVVVLERHRHAYAAAGWAAIANPVSGLTSPAAATSSSAWSWSAGVRLPIASAAAGAAAVVHGGGQRLA